MSGADTVQVYVKDPAAADEPPEQLRAFSRVLLGAGQTRVIEMSFPVANLRTYQDCEFQYIPDTYQVNVGNSSSDSGIHLNIKVA